MILLLVGILLNLGQESGWDGDTEIARCLVCHQRISLRLEDTLSSRYTTSPPYGRYESGDHGGLRCITCHGNEFRTIPHAPTDREPIQCSTCHRDDIMPCSHLPFMTYEESHGGDIHFAYVEGFDCGSCHDPHLLTISRCAPPAETNVICLRCHPSQSMNVSHLRFPAARLHLEYCSCGDCHFPSDSGSVSHFVLPAEASLSDCRGCHSKAQAVVRFPERIQTWGARRIPGWRSGVTMEMLFAVSAIILWSGAILLRLVRSGPHVFTRLFPPGPSSKIRGITIAALLLTGFAIYAGDGIWLTHMAHIHVLAGVLLLAVLFERVFLIRGLPLHTAGQVILKFRSLLIGVLLVSGISLLVPSITDIIDALVPRIRIIHRFSAIILLIWYTAIALRD